MTRPLPQPQIPPLPKPVDKQRTNNPWQIPWDTKAEAAKIHILLAEQRYRIALQRGQAWDVAPRSNRNAIG